MKETMYDMNSKTCDYDKFEDYIKKKNKINQLLVHFKKHANPWHSQLKSRIPHQKSVRNADFGFSRTSATNSYCKPSI